MQYTQAQLTELWNHGNSHVDDPIDRQGSLVVHILKNEQKIQNMMVTVPDRGELKKFSDHDDVRAKTAKTTIIYSRTHRQEDAWANWCVEEEIA